MKELFNIITDKPAGGSAVSRFFDAVEREALIAPMYDAAVAIGTDIYKKKLPTCNDINNSHTFRRGAVIQDYIDGDSDCIRFETDALLADDAHRSEEDGANHTEERYARIAELLPEQQVQLPLLLTETLPEPVAAVPGFRQPLQEPSPSAL